MSCAFVYNAEVSPFLWQNCHKSTINFRDITIAYLIGQSLANILSQISVLDKCKLKLWLQMYISTFDLFSIFAVQINFSLVLMSSAVILKLLTLFS